MLVLPLPPCCTRAGRVPTLLSSHVRAGESSWGRAGPIARREQRLLLDRVPPAVAPGIAAQQSPGGQHQPTEYAELANRLEGVGRASRLVLAAARQAGRDPAAVGPNGRADGAARPATRRRRPRPLRRQAR